MSKSGVINLASLTVAGVDLSADTESMGLNLGQAGLAFHAFGDTTAIETPGLFTWSASGRMFHDFAATKVDAIIGAAYLAKSTLSLIMQEVAGARSATNPGYSGLAFVSVYNNPVGGTHGQVGMCDVTFSPASAITRMTS